MDAPFSKNRVRMVRGGGFRTLSFACWKEVIRFMDVFLSPGGLIGLALAFHAVCFSRLHARSRSWNWLEQCNAWLATQLEEHVLRRVRPEWFG